MYDLYSTNCTKNVSKTLFKNKLFSNLPILTTSISSWDINSNVTDLNKIFIEKKKYDFFY